MSHKIHRWQPTGFTPCGYNVQKVHTNIGHFLSDGVTCERCHSARSLMSIMSDDWNGQSDGAPDQRTAAELARIKRDRQA